MANRVHDSMCRGPSYDPMVRVIGGWSWRSIARRYACGREFVKKLSIPCLPRKISCGGGWSVI